MQMLRVTPMKIVSKIELWEGICFLSSPAQPYEMGTILSVR